MSNLWGGRFAGGLEARFEAFNRSLAVDSRMWREDIEGSLAWAKELRAAGVLSDAEQRSIAAGLATIQERLAKDPSELLRSDAEDIHSFIEGELRAAIGDVARKLHTGRSRNDQVATDLKLYLRRRVHQLELGIRELDRALLDMAARHARDPMPGFTHLQRAQPLTIGHYLLAFVEMFARDRARLVDARARMDTCPLGSGALAGTAFPIDRSRLARDLGFAQATRNSVDSVSDRDHACELAFACSMVLLHISRLAEDWIFFATQEARFLVLSDAIATGSSLMPQKKNPDSLELLRGKSARVFGALQSLLVLQKGLPLAYDKDLQEDKHALFDALDTTEASLEIARIVVLNASFDLARCRSEATRGYANSTDLADWLVRSGIPFRDAHERAGRVVRAALELGQELEDLAPEVWRSHLPELEAVATETWRKELSVEAVLARRAAKGGTAPDAVGREIEEWNQRMESWNSPS